MKKNIKNNPVRQQDSSLRRLLVVDDEKLIRELLEDFLSLEGFHVKTCADGPSALKVLKSEQYDLILSDLKMPEMNGIELIKEARKISPTLVPIIMTGFGTLETAVDSMKHGAFDYILKPFKVEDVLRIVDRGLKQAKLEQENISLKEIVHIYNSSEIISNTIELEEVYKCIVKSVTDVLDPDYVALYLKTEKDFEISIEYEEQDKFTDNNLPRQINFNKLLKYFKQDKPCLLQKEKISPLFKNSTAKKVAVNSFTAIPIRGQNEILGFVTALSYSSNKVFNEGQRKALAVIADRAASAIENAILYNDLQNLFYQTVESFAKAIEAKDKYTHGHSERVSELAGLIAKELKLPQEEIRAIEQAAILHDIGKLSVDLSTLNYQGKLEGKALENFRQHPRIGREILRPIQSLAKVIPYIYHHHEYWDGSGYPDQLKGNKIPLGARILSVADSYDAMTSDRAYRSARPHAAAVEELINCAGSQFDPQVIKAFIIAVEKRKK